MLFADRGREGYRPCQGVARPMRDDRGKQRCWGRELLKIEELIAGEMIGRKGFGGVK